MAGVLLDGLPTRQHHGRPDHPQTRVPTCVGDQPLGQGRVAGQQARVEDGQHHGPVPGGPVPGGHGPGEGRIRRVQHVPREVHRVAVVHGEPGTQRLTGGGAAHRALHRPPADDDPRRVTGQRSRHRRWRIWDVGREPVV